MSRLFEQSPQAFAARLTADCQGRAYLFCDPHTRRPHGSSESLADLVRCAERGDMDFRNHEAIFLEVGPETGALFGAFLHQSLRGQAQGGVRHWPYTQMEEFLRDGLRLSLGMTRKNALAGLWWGGGKGLIARPATPCDPRDPGWRRTLYREFGAFVSSLRGCYIAGEDVGTTGGDMAEIFAATRFATCTPRRVGGSGEPAPYTAAGVLCAIEAALEFLGLGSLADKKIAMQGTGNVGSALVRLLLEKGVREIVASEISRERCESLLDAFSGEPVHIRRVEPDDLGILAEPCDVLVPCALGGILGPKTIPSIQARVICGPANNQFADDERDGAALQQRGITQVPDFVANRMGIVNCANEQYGAVNHDPAVQQHLDPNHTGGIRRTTLRVLELAGSSGVTPIAAANQLADDLAERPHPIWGDRARQIVASLIADRWHEHR